MAGDLHELLDRSTDAVQEPLPSGEYAALVAEVDRAVHRLEAVKLRLVAAADRADVGALSGMSGTGAWLAKQTRTAGAAAAGQVTLAAALEALPATGAALDAGEVSPEHAAVIAGATRRLPETLDAEQRARVETRLVAQAKTLDPVALRTKARRALEEVTTKAEADRHHDATLRDEEAAARAKTRLVLHDNTDGTISGHFTVPTLAGVILRKIIQQLASPRRGRLGATDAHTGPVGDRIDWPQRYGHALIELLEHLPTDSLHTKTAATIVITLDHTQLLTNLAAAGLDTGHEISPSEARRIACGAGLLPAILNGDSLPLDLGRQQRFFTQTQRVALATQWTSCAAHACDRPYAWCDLHHRKPWTPRTPDDPGGTTNLNNAIPLCGFHHHRIHDPTYHHQEHPDHTITFHRRT